MNQPHHRRRCLLRMFLPAIAVFVVTPSIVVAQINTLIGRVTAVRDGDSLFVLDNKKTQHEVRLFGMDAPEHEQAFGSRAKQALSAKVFGKVIRVEWVEKDKHERKLGKVMIGARWVNREMIAEGFAWHYKQYSDDAELAKAENIARRAKRGLWADPNPVPPWDFRHNAAKEKGKTAK